MSDVSAVSEPTDPNTPGVDRTPRTRIAGPVPAWYPTTAGRAAVTVFGDGVVPLPAASMAVNADPAELDGWLGERMLPNASLPSPLNTLLIETADRVVLVDGGLGSLNPEATRAGRLTDRLAEAGVALGTITDVVVTHLHLDHIGGFLDEAWSVGLDPSLRVHVAERELEFWAKPDLSTTVIPEAFWPMVTDVSRQFLDRYQDRFVAFDDGHEVAPEVVARLAPGHTPGHSVVEVGGDGDRLVFASDVAFAVSFDRPGWHNGFDHDGEQAVATRAEVVDRAIARGDRLVCTHLSFPGLGRVADAGAGRYRWLPEVWSE